ncbi:PIG-L family deacetylase [Hymenobacter sp. BT683]|uniref:PIG-L family deacetylase n=1 Tax=Hymenobacter jeongseonensis TaxID=2791027 RepID=A0ABS0IFD3_9BACT|nr:PIG-L deacetylase family protein [Hymenobacter jeongseonensis]MBF9237062.1 PIG-L family deacetylase [Hymenobacter jeongseonensis]
MSSETALPFSAYPIRDASFVASLGATVVIAPHPDDEALGCGGLMALFHHAAMPVAAVLVSDGSMSHPASQLFSGPARRAVREAEFRHALSILGTDAQEPLLLGLPDGRVPASAEEPSFAEAATQLREFLEQYQAATVVVPWRRDPHPDHRATSQLVQAALAGMATAPRLLEYVVWAWERAAPADLPTDADKVTGFRLDIGAVVAQKQRAIAAHRSQVTPGVFTDDPGGFLLSAEMLAHFSSPYEVFFEALPS